jgi:flagellar protein FliJ
MSERFPLQILLERAQEALDLAARQLARAQREHADAQRQLAALQRYRDEYLTNFTKTAQAGGMPAGNWRNFQAFVDTLDAAIQQQQRVLDAAQTRLDAARPEWQEKKRAHGAYELLIERNAQQAARVAARRDQRDTDEFAANALRLRAARAG